MQRHAGVALNRLQHLDIRLVPFNGFFDSIFIIRIRRLVEQFLCLLQLCRDLLLVATHIRKLGAGIICALGCAIYEALLHFEFGHEQLSCFGYPHILMYCTKLREDVFESSRGCIPGLPEAGSKHGWKEKCGQHHPIEHRRKVLLRRFEPMTNLNRSPMGQIGPIDIIREEAKPVRFEFHRSMIGSMSPCFSRFIAPLSLLVILPISAAASNPPIPAAKADVPLASQAGKERAVFAGGCFWGTQSVFERVKGVTGTAAGYAGGSAATATYDQVTTETTGHAESVEVICDPSKITYGQLLRIFFSVAHDPTQLNRQGPDVGISYRSAIFYANDEQRKIASAYIDQLNNAKVFPRPIVTQLTALKGFYRAEDYHQDYALKHPDNPYIQVCDRPKIEALKQQFPEYFVEYTGKKSRK